jgi:hypothetical protein
LCSVLHEVKPERKHIFEGLGKRIKITKQQKTDIPVIDPDEWNGNEECIDILTILFSLELHWLSSQGYEVMTYLKTELP